ncbi:putative protein EARLY FLOWERING 4 [Helianthus annuus]|nr:putative protein EARLY FLOWERING 4 [Helianthus annuus]KAJ0862840.1 putative protein EARLY FLOWERING 4 [Helianthus annuus]KAJ0866666.1 putative protein EARLY FLOWERING 4 [Helianthus annuus]
MTTLNSSSSSSGGESTMDEQSNPQPPSSTVNNNNGISDDEENSEESQALWSTFTDSFREVQSVLERNRVLIQQVNENHRSKNHESMVSNVALIQEINNNVSKIVAMYADLSVNFSTVFHQRKETD